MLYTLGIDIISSRNPQEIGKAFALAGTFSKIIPLISKTGVKVESVNITPHPISGPPQSHIIPMEGIKT